MWSNPSDLATRILIPSNEGAGAGVVSFTVRVFESVFVIPPSEYEASIVAVPFLTPLIVLPETAAVSSSQLTVELEVTTLEVPSEYFAVTIAETFEPALTAAPLNLSSIEERTTPLVISTDAEPDTLLPSFAVALTVTVPAPVAVSTPF